VSDVRLIVQADDFGMCHAVNVGVAEAFRNGILTQAAMMVPCPWFMEAARLARANEIPVGMHATLTCDWDYYRWPPLTTGSSLVDEDGTFHRTVKLAAPLVDYEEARVELMAQAARMIAAGVAPLYIDEHMGNVCTEACASLCRELDRPFLYPHVDPHPEMASIKILSTIPQSRKLDWLLDHLASLGPGLHLIQTHPGVASPELRSMTAPDSPVAPWAEEYRVSDLKALTHEKTLKCVADLGIRLTSMADI